MSNHSRVIQERHLRLNVHKVDLPSSLSELVSWTRRRFHAVTTLRSIASANSVTLHVGLGLCACICHHELYFQHISRLLAPCCLQPAVLVVSVIDIWMTVSSIFFLNRYSSYSFSLIFTKLGTRDLCANTQNIVEHIFRILILKFLMHFSNFKFGLSLWNSSSRAMYKGKKGKGEYSSSWNSPQNYGTPLVNRPEGPSVLNNFICFFNDDVFLDAVGLVSGLVGKTSIQFYPVLPWVIG